MKAHEPRGRSLRPRARTALGLLLAAAAGLVPLAAQASPSARPQAPAASPPGAAAPAAAPAAPKAAKPDLVLGPGDLRIEQRGDGGYHLFVRRKPGLGSVLLTETTKDPAMKADNYAYRTAEPNPLNGGEKRILDGKFIPPESKIHSLIDSSFEPDPEFGEALHIYIPWVVQWGYAWSRSGETFISDGTFINVRAFERPYADYRGAFADNPYLIRVTQRPLPRPIRVVEEPKPEVAAPVPAAPAAAKPELAEPAAPPPPAPLPPAPPKPEPKKPDLSMYMDDTVKSFNAIAKAGMGEVRYSEGEGDIVPQLADLLDRAKGKSVDLVLCIDTTDSMKDDIEAVKKAIPDMLRERLADFGEFRLGLVVYKDYFEDYLVRKWDFTKDFSAFTSRLSEIKVAGGRDIPEAVYEALHTGLTAYPWAAEKRLIVLIGDAPPHPLPRGNVDRAKVEAEAAKKGVELDVIILPH